MGLRYEIWRGGELFIADVLCDEALTVGPRRAHVPTDALDEPMALLSRVAAGYRLALAAPLAGEIVTGGRRLRVRDGLLYDPRPEPLLLREGDSGQLSLDGELELRFSVTAERARLRRFGGVDWSLLTTVASVAVAVIIGASLIGEVTPPPQHKLAGVKLVRVAPAQFPRPKPRAKRRSKPKRDAKTSAVASAPRRRRRSARRPRRRRMTKAAPRRRARLARVRRAAPRRVADLAAALSAAASSKPPAAVRRGDKTLVAAAVAAPSSPLRASQPTHVSAVMPRLPSETHLSLALSAAAKPKARRALSLGRTARSKRPTREAIARAVGRGTGRIRHCFERELLVSGDSIQGRLLVRWRIDAQGRARALSVVRDSVKRARIRKCVLRVVRSLRFPACGGAGCRVTFPFELYVRS